MGKPNIIPNRQSIKMIPNDIRIYINMIQPSSENLLSTVDGS